MESIRVLQDTFEQLYALSFPMGQYLDSHLPKLEKDWFKKLFLEEEISGIIDSVEFNKS